MLIENLKHGGILELNGDNGLENMDLPKLMFLINIYEFLPL